MSSVAIAHALIGKLGSANSDLMEIDFRLCSYFSEQKLHMLAPRQIRIGRDFSTMYR